jgi:hypothetical protein
LAQAVTGQTVATLRSPAIAVLLLAAYAAAAFAAGAAALQRRDIA